MINKKLILSVIVCGLASSVFTHPSEKKDKKGALTTILTSNAFRGGLLLGGGLATGFLLAKYIMIDAEGKSNLPFKEVAIKKGVESLKIVSQLALLGGIPPAASELTKYFLYSRKNFKKAEKPNIDEVYMNALDFAPGPLMELCKILEGEGEDDNSCLSFGGNPVPSISIMPLGYILEGPPGCGKTEFARAMSHKFELGFHHIRSTDIIGSFYSESAANLRRTFESIQSSMEPNGFALLFIDEIDALFSKRISEAHNSAINEENVRTTTEFLQQLQGFSQSNKKIIVIGATNRYDVLDPAVKSRLAKISMNAPNKLRRTAALEQQTLKILGIQFTDQLTKMVAKRTEGFSYRELHQLISGFARTVVAQPEEHPVDVLDECINNALTTHASVNENSQPPFGLYQ